MAGAYEVMLQPEEVPPQGDRDIYLGSTVHGGDAHEKPPIGLRKARVLLLVHHNP